MVKHAARDRLDRHAARGRRGRSARGEPTCCSATSWRRSSCEFNPWLTRRSGARRSSKPSRRSRRPSRATARCWRGCAASGSGTTRTRSATGPSRSSTSRTRATTTFASRGSGRSSRSARKGNRADVMFVVNGLPVAIVEHKNPKDGGALDRGIKQLRRYEKETPELLGAPQLFNVTHLLDYWYGVTWNANRRFIRKWKQTPDEELPLRGAGVLRADRLPAHAPALDSLLRRGRRDPEVGPARAPAPRDRQDRRPLRRPGEEPRPRSGTPRARARPSRC